MRWRRWNQVRAEVCDYLIVRYEYADFVLSADLVEAVEDDVSKQDSNKANLRVFMIAITECVFRERVWADPHNFGE